MDNVYVPIWNYFTFQRVNYEYLEMVSVAEIRTSFWRAYSHL